MTSRSPDPRPSVPDSRAGILAGLGAYGLWGLFPLYFTALAAAGALEIVAHRALWAFLLCLLIVLLTSQWATFTVLWRSRRAVLLLSVAAILLAVNWLVYVYAVTTGRTLDAAVGYYLNPLVTVLLGVVVLGERLRRLQWAALSAGAIAVVVLMVSGSSAPHLSLLLAFSFGFYGLVKKKVGALVSPVSGMAVETAVMLVPALGYLAWLYTSARATFATGVETGLPPGVLELLLVLSGAVTTAPLLLFAMAAQRLALSTVGLIQFLTPTVQFFLAWLVFHEPMPTARWLGFAAVWVAVALVSVDLVRAGRRARWLRHRTPPGSAEH